MKTLWMMLLAVTVTANANVDDKDIYLTIDSDAVNTSQKSLSGIKSLHSSNGISVLKVKASEIENLSALMHDKFNRCGGFIVHDSEQEALEVISNNTLRNTAKNADFLNYTISEGATVQNMLTQVNEFSIRETILKLSSFKNRYYKSQTGVDSQAWLKKSWETLAAGRSDVSVDYFKHSNFPQPSVIMTVEGSSLKNEIVILGGHADSISGYWGRERARAPGADDNASGIATITEVIRVMMDSSYKPERTIKFMAYAAEEVGLLGSKAIANDFKAKGKKVVGVVQFDMTNHKGTSDLDIVFMTDFTNQAQTKFMGTLIDTYIPGVTWGYSKCGYGCSDHASWHNAGYPASMPFESTMGDINGKIHTKNDTIDATHSHGTADHAEKFTRLGVAFMVEMGK
jgi:leucyl aminopeptidase